MEVMQVFDGAVTEWVGREVELLNWLRGHWVDEGTSKGRT